MKARAGDYERDGERGLLLPRGARRGEPRVHPAAGVGPAFFSSVGGGGGSADPLFANVLLLLNWPGAEGSTICTDSSSYARTATRNGTPTITTAGLKTGGGSAVLDGTGDNWTFPDAAEWELGSPEFCFEGSAYKDFSGQTRFILSHRRVAAPDGGYFVLVNSSNQLRFASLGGVNFNQVDLVSTSTIGSGSTFDWAVTKKVDLGTGVTTTRLFLNGVVEASSTAWNGPVESDGLMYIGTSSGEDGTRDWKGKLGPIRITAGAVSSGAYRHDANYTPSTSAFPGA